MIATTHLNERIAHLLRQRLDAQTFPALMAPTPRCSASSSRPAASKWVIEAPYVMKAAHELHVHLGWMVACYDLGEALANLVQPFWMLPTLALLGLRARDVMGYTFVVFLVLLPLGAGARHRARRDAAVSAVAKPALSTATPSAGNTRQFPASRPVI